MLRGGVSGVERGQPGVHRRHHLVFIAAGQLKLGPVSHPVGRVGEQANELLDRTLGHRLDLRQRPVVHHHAIHAAVLPVAAGIAEVVLHVADDRVLPIREVDRPVGAHFEIGGPEVHIA